MKGRRKPGPAQEPGAKERSAEEIDLDFARRSLAFSLTELRRMRARLEEGSRLERVPFGDREILKLRMPWKAGAFEDYLYQPAEDLAEGVEVALRFLEQGKTEAALAVVAHLLENHAATLDRTALGFKEEDRKVSSKAGSTRKGMGRPAKVGASQRAEIVRRAKEIRDANPALRRSNSRTAELISKAFACQPDGPFALLAALPLKTVAKIIAESGPRKSSAKG